MASHPLDLPPLRRADGTPARALVVDDEEALADAVAIALRSDGWVAESMYRGRDVPHVVREQRPDLVVLDIMLPGVDGFEVCRRLRSSAPIPVVMLTARTDEDDRWRATMLDSTQVAVEMRRLVALCTASATPRAVGSCSRIAKRAEESTITSAVRTRHRGPRRSGSPGPGRRARPGSGRR